MNRYVLTHPAKAICSESFGHPFYPMKIHNVHIRSCKVYFQVDSIQQTDVAM